MVIILLIIFLMEEIEKFHAKDSCNSTSKAVTGASVNLTCQFQSKNILWDKDGITLYSDNVIKNNYSSHIEVLENGHILNISNIEKSYGGNYVCIDANNTMQETDHCLQILDAPRVEVDFNRSKLFCNASDWFNMTLRYKWRYATKFNVQLRDVSESTSALQLNKSLPIFQNDGKYSCIVESQTEDEELIATSTEVLVDLPGEPVCINNEINIFAKHGDSTTVQVHLYGKFRRQEDVVWWCGNETVNTSLNKYTVQTEGSNITTKVYDSVVQLEVNTTCLTIQNLTEEDSAEYTVKVAGYQVCTLHLEISKSDGFDCCLSVTTIPALLVYIVVCTVILVVVLVTFTLYRLRTRRQQKANEDRNVRRPPARIPRQDHEMVQLRSQHPTTSIMETEEIHLSDKYSRVLDTVKNENYVFTEIE